MWKSTIVMVLCGGWWVLAGPAANGQMGRPADSRRQAARPYSTALDSTAPVSPYVNLGFTANGLSNYQTLVRPLVEEREALARQSAALEQLDQRLRGAPGARFRNDVEGASPQRQSTVRFMDYSHYFGTFR